MSAFCPSFSSKMRRGMTYVGENLCPPHLSIQIPILHQQMFPKIQSPARCLPSSSKTATTVIHVGAKARRPTPHFQSRNQTDYVSKNPEETTHVCCLPSSRTITRQCNVGSATNFSLPNPRRPRIMFPKISR
jgi:hypothetical protein